MADPALLTPQPHAPATHLGVAPWLALAEPAAIFSHPSEVLSATGLTREEKRAILASWASDAWAVESAPALRHAPGGGPPVRLDDVLAALNALDPDISGTGGALLSEGPGSRPPRRRHPRATSLIERGFRIFGAGR